MAYTQKIHFYKVRSFSQKLNATIEFIRQNVGIIAKTVVIILGPLAILSGLLFAKYIGFVFSTMSSGDLEAAQDPFQFMLNPSYIGFLILMVVGGLFNFAIIFNFMRLYHERYPEPITVTEVLNASWRDVLPLFVLGVIIVIMVVFGFIAFILPGIYLMIALSMAMPVLFYERKDIIESISRGLKLISGKWWSTFGLMLVSTVMMQAVSFIFIIPFYVFYFIAIFTVVGEGTTAMDLNALWFQVGMTLSVIFMFLGTFLVNCIPTVALSFQYFNLVERRQSVGLLSEIDKLPTE